MYVNTMNQELTQKKREIKELKQVQSKQIISVL